MHDGAGQSPRDARLPTTEHRVKVAVCVYERCIYVVLQASVFSAKPEAIDPGVCLKRHLRIRGTLYTYQSKGCSSIYLSVIREAKFDDSQLHHPLTIQTTWNPMDQLGWVHLLLGPGLFKAILSKSGLSPAVWLQ